MAMERYLHRSVQELWNAVVNLDDGDRLYPIMQALYSKLTLQLDDTTLVVPPVISKLFSILSSAHHRLRLKCLTCAILSVIAKTRDLKTLIAQKGCSQFIVESVCDYVEEGKAGILWTDLDLLFLEQVTFLAQKLSWNCVGAQKMMLDLGCLTAFSNLCNINNSPLLKYCAPTLDLMRNLTEGKNLVARIFDLTVSKLKDMYFYQFGENYRSFLLPETGITCEIYDTTVPGKDIQISHELVRNNVAFADKSSKCDGGHWIDIHVTCVPDIQEGHDLCFWAQFGEDAPQNIQKVQDILKKAATNVDDGVTLIVYSPKPLHLVGGYNELLGYYRAQVLATKKEKVKLFTLDYGKIIYTEWASLFYLTAEMNLKEIPPQAVPCCLAGVRPPPRNMNIMERAITTVMNLTSDKVDQGSIESSSCNQMLLELAEAHMPVCTQLACSTLANIAHSTEMQSTLGNLDTISILLGVCQEFMQHSLEDELTVKVLCSALSALANLLFQHLRNKKEFIRLDGTKVLASMATQAQNVRVKRAAMYVFANLFGVSTGAACQQLRKGVNILKSVDDQIFSHQSVRSRSQQRGRGSSARDHSAPASYSRTAGNRGWGGRGRSLSGGRRDDSLSRKELVLNPARLTQDEDSSDEENGKFPHGSSGKSSGDSPDSEAEGEILFPGGMGDSSAKPRLGNGLMAAGGAVGTSAGPTDEQYYVKGRLMDQVSDQKHEFRQSLSMDKVKAATISKVVCAFLNAGSGGSIYFGVQAGVIHGVRLSRDDRDQLRQGVDQLMLRITPPVLHSVYEVHYYKVVAQKGHEDPLTRRHIEDRFIVEILVKPCQTGFYITADGESFVREGNRTKIVTAMDVYRKAIIEEENKLQREVERLEEDIARYKAEKAGTFKLGS